MPISSFVLGVALLIPAVSARAAGPEADPRLRAVLAPLEEIAPSLTSGYVELHGSPELSFQEKETSRKMAARLRAAGFEVTEKVGGFGVVGVLKNGDGPVLLLRTDMDALPVEERTGAPFASRVTATNETGSTVPVMHACGHDLHMTIWSGAAELLARGRSSWRGTLVLIAQPAEERGAGARAMLQDGLLTRFPRPSYALALHVEPDLATGTVGVAPGPAMAAADSVDVVIHGRGGHGASPQKTVDPIVIGARFVLALQTLVSRENDPFEPAVVTVGSFQGGAKHNVIPDEVHLKLTVRSYSVEVQKHLLDGIRRLAKAEAEGARAPREPEVTVSEGLPAVLNDPALSERLMKAFGRALGTEAVFRVRPATVSEDFGLLAHEGIPSVLFRLGVTDPKVLSDAKAAGTSPPGLHSGDFLPESRISMRTGITAFVAAALELLPAR